jgi:hypothetical protein
MKTQITDVHALSKLAPHQSFCGDFHDILRAVSQEDIHYANRLFSFSSSAMCQAVGHVVCLGNQLTDSE